MTIELGWVDIFQDIQGLKKEEKRLKMKKKDQKVITMPKY